MCSYCIFLTTTIITTTITTTTIATNTNNTNNTAITSSVLALVASTSLRAAHATGVALTVLLQTVALLAMTAQEVLLAITIRINTRSEGIRVTIEYAVDGLLPSGLGVSSISTVDAVAAVAIVLHLEAVAVQLEAVAFATVACYRL